MKVRILGFKQKSKKDVEIYFKNAEGRMTQIYVNGYLTAVFGALATIIKRGMEHNQIKKEQAIYIVEKWAEMVIETIKEGDTDAGNPVQR